ncbi:hypothetical protein [Tamlana flava]|uniref:hypothetical protein n=1 Tax=Tamlana flava TaxID=3158572 RepID=UPI00351ADE72
MKTILQLLILLLLTSCVSHRVYATPSYGSLYYAEKKHYGDKKTTETYVSGDLSFGRHMQDAEAFDDAKNSFIKCASQHHRPVLHLLLRFGSLDGYISI